MSGALAGARAKWAGVFLGLLLVVDLGRADAHWITYMNYKEKYVDNPITDILRDKPFQQRVTALRLPAGPEAANLQQVFLQIYDVEWKQHLFQYHSIQSLDIIQQSRTPEDYAAFEGALQRTQYTADTIHLIARRWQLTNTRYLLGLAGFLEPLNQQIDPAQKRFRIHTVFDFSQSPNGTILTQTNAAGRFALFEFTGALPRAKLYANWQVASDDPAALQLLASPAFNPEQSVLVANPIPAANPSGTAQPFDGSVVITKYAPRLIQLKANTKVPSVLLLNDKFDPDWKVTVNGHPEPLLRCNYIMRGVLLQPGDQTIEFRFQPPVNTLYVSLTAVILGLGACVWLAFSKSPIASTTARAATTSAPKAA